MQAILDKRDQQLLALLQANARESISNLARKVGLSRTAVQERINKLQSRGIIDGYTVKLNKDWQQSQVAAFITIVVDPKRAGDVVADLEKIQDIQAVWTVSGLNDIIAFAQANSTRGIDALLDRVGGLTGVSKTDSSIVLSTRFDRR